MVPRLVPEISSLHAFCDGGAAGAAGAAAAGIGDSRSLIYDWIKIFRTTRIEIFRAKITADTAIMEPAGG